MSTVDASTNPQINHDDDTITTHATEQQKIDKAAGEMASKAGKVEYVSETHDTVGGVRATSGGIFTK